MAGAFVRVTTDKIDGEIDRWLERIVLALGLDRSTIAEINPADGWAIFSHGWAREPEHIIGKSLDANALMPWVKKKMLAGETVVMPSVDPLPATLTMPVPIPLSATMPATRAVMSITSQLPFVARRMLC